MTNVNLDQDIAKIIGGRYSAANILDFSDHAFGKDIQKILQRLGDDHAVVLAPVGAGKTHLAAAISKAKGILPHYMKFDEFVRDCEQRSYRGDNYKIHLHALCNSRFLILEDMGIDRWYVSHTSPLIKEILLQVIRERRMYLKPTLFLAAHGKEDFLKMFCDTLWEEQKVPIWEFPEAPSMRQKGY